MFKITNSYICENSSMFVSSTIDFDKFSKDLLNVTMSFIEMLCLYFFTTCVYMSKENMENISTSDFG